MSMKQHKSTSELEAMVSSNRHELTYSNSFFLNDFQLNKLEMSFTFFLLLQLLDFLRVSKSLYSIVD